MNRLSGWAKSEIMEEEFDQIIKETRASEMNKYQSSFTVLFQEKFSRITINLSSIWFILMSNFSISNYVLPILLLRIFGNDALGGNLFKNVLIGSIFSIPGPLVAGLLTNIPSLGRVKTMSFAFLIGIFFTLLIIVNPRNIIIWDTLMKLALGCGFNSMRIYISEAYPTKIRAIGNGLGNSIGKVANVIAPFLSELLMYLLGAYSPYGFIVLSTAFSIFNVYSLPFETLGRALDEDIEEDKKVELDEFGKS